VRGGNVLSRGTRNIRVLPVRPELEIGPATLQAWVNEPLQSRLPHVGGQEPVTIRTLAKLPRGILLEGDVLKGTPIAAGLVRIPVVMRDAIGDSARGEILLRIGNRF
jgi:hypothetical protein